MKTSALTELVRFFDSRHVAFFKQPTAYPRAKLKLVLRAVLMKHDRNLPAAQNELDAFFRTSLTAAAASPERLLRPPKPSFGRNSVPGPSQSLPGFSDFDVGNAPR